MLVGHQIWDRPVYPHPYDEEFESDFNISDWSVYAYSSITGTLDPSDVNAYDTGVPGGQLRLTVNPETRRSWLLAQNGIGGNGLAKQITFPTNLLIVSRFKFNMRYTGNSANDATFALVVSADAGGGTRFDTNTLALYANESDGTTQAQSTVINGAGFGQTTTNLTSEGSPLEYFAIHKIGSAWHMWVGTASGNWIWMEDGTISWTPEWVGWWFDNTVITAPGAGVTGIDFLRFYETDKFPF